MLRTTLAFMLVSSLAGCSRVMPPLKCTVPPPSSANHGPEAPQAETTSLTIAMSQSYMQEKIKAQLATALPPSQTQTQVAVADGMPGADVGADVSAVRLEQRAEQGQTLNLLAVELVPWAKGAQKGASKSMQNMLSKANVTARPLTLRLRIVPHLITPATVPDQGQRSSILACDAGDATCAGAVLSFEFYELYDSSFKRVVACSGATGKSPADMLSKQVVDGVKKALASQAPLRLPTAGLLSMITAITGAPANLTGMSLGSEGDLKIGLLLDVGVPRPFDPHAAFRSTNEDWAVTLDNALLVGQVDKTLADSASANSPPVAFNQPSTVTFRAGGMDVSATGTAPTPIPGCPVQVDVKLQIAVSACTRGDQTPIMRMCPSAPQATTSLAACGAFAKAFGSFAQPKTTTVNCPSCQCADTPIKFVAAPDDTLYVTKVDTDGVFEITGRSTFHDALLGVQPGTAGPAACP